MENSYNFIKRLKLAEPEIQEFIKTLESENLKLKKKIGKLEAKIVTLNNEIALLEEENAQCIEHKKNLQSLSSKELAQYMQDRLKVTSKINKKNS